MEVLIFVSGYPSNENIYNCTWAHTRSLEYLKCGITPYILNFGCSQSYIYEDVMVFPQSDIEILLKKNIETLIMHSPNVRNHFRLLKKVGEDRFDNIIIFCHGTESMSINHDYPQPYTFMKESIVKRLIRDIYDKYKFFYFRNFLKKNLKKIHIVFVSEWMKNVFVKNIFNLNSSSINIEYSIINNSINEVFLNKKYSSSDEHFANFITIRRFDESKYAIDLLVEHALANKDKTYHLYGKGSYFKYHRKPENLKIFDHFIKPEDIPELLNHYDCAFMPTRCDAQGVMMCEMASYGIPLITNNIDVTKEMLTSFSNAIFFNKSDFSEVFNLNNLSPLTIKNLRFSNSNTSEKEVELLRKLGGK